MSDVTITPIGKCEVCGTLLSRELSGGGMFCSVDHQEIAELRAEIERIKGPCRVTDAHCRHWDAGGICCVCGIDASQDPYYRAPQESGRLQGDVEE